MKSKLSAALVAVIAVVLAILATPALAQYTFTRFNVPGANDTALNDINDSGRVVGEYDYKAFVSTNGQITTITVPGSSGISAASGINNAGQVVVQAEGQGGFVYTNGSFAPVTVPGGAVAVDDINNNGQIVGIFYPNGVQPGFGYIATYGSFTPISFPGASATYTVGINDKDQVVGYYQPAPGGAPRQNFVYTNGSFTPISVPGSIDTFAAKINNSGQIVGYYIDALGAQYGFVDTNGQFTTVAVPGASGTGIEGINDLGQIVGYAGGYGAFIGTPIPGFVPVPGPIAGAGLPGLIAACGGMLGWWRRKKIA